MNNPPKVIEETLEALRFFTRLPIVRGTGAPPPFSRALPRAPYAGALLGLGGGLALLVATRLGAPPQIAAWLVVGFSAIVTGAMHEDGLADVADGFGGGYSREKRLDIMRDSRIGAFGASALIVSFGLRVAALTALAAAPGRAVLVLVAAGAVSRAACLAPLVLLAPARVDGAGRAAVLTLDQARAAWIAALVFGLAPALSGFSVTSCLLALLLAGLATRALCALAQRMIGGQTGDVAGAAQQAAEIAVLAVFAGSV